MDLVLAELIAFERHDAAYKAARRLVFDRAPPGPIDLSSLAPEQIAALTWYEECRDQYAQARARNRRR